MIVPLELIKDKAKEISLLVAKNASVSEHLCFPYIYLGLCEILSISPAAQPDDREPFVAWCFSEGLMQESYGIRSVNSVCDTAWKAWRAGADLTAALRESAPADIRSNQVAPKDYKLVPIQPTSEMIAAGLAQTRLTTDEDEDPHLYRAKGQAAAVYHFMLDAAPVAPVAQKALPAAFNAEKSVHDMQVALERLMDCVEEPPEKNCSCHISPPCSDCLDHGELREAISDAQATIAAAGGAS